MLAFKYIAGKNLVTYKDFYYDFTTAPLQIIRGRNRSGKSLLFSALGNILYNTAMLDQRRGSGRRMHSIDSATEVCLASNGWWRFRQLGNGKNVTYNIFHGDEELRPTRIADAQKIINGVVTQPEDVFYTTCLLNPHREHPLLNSKPGVRHDYFETVFNLGVYDVIHQRLLTQAGTIKSAAVSLAQLRRSHEELDRTQEKLPPPEKYNDIVSRWQSLQKTHQGRVERSQNVAAWLAIAEAIKFRQPLSVLLTELTRLTQQVKELEAYWQGLQYQYNQYQTYKKHREQIAQLDKEIADLPGDDYNGILRELQVLQNHANSINVFTPLLTEYTEKQKQWQKLPAITFSEENEQQLIIYRDRLKNMKKISGSHCPTCGQLVVQEVLQATQTELSAQIIVLKQRKEEAQAYLADKKLQQRLDELKIKICKTPDGVYLFNHRKSLANMIKQIKNKISTNTDKLQMAEQRQELLHTRATLLSIQTEATAIEYSQVEQAQQNYQRTTQRCNLLKNDIELHEKLQNIGNYGDPVMVRANYEQLQKQLRHDGTLLNELHAELQKMRDIKVRHDLRAQELAKLQKKIDELTLATEKSEIYEYLLLAYGPKGLRVNMVQNLTQAWVNNMNSNAHFIFAEPYRFSLDVDINRFIILAERSGNISEIAGTLSGSERSCFALLNMLALPELLPSRHRNNIAILDEAESHLDAVSLQLYATDFIPRLATIMPYITIVTPKGVDEFAIPDAKELRVIKQRGVSQLRDA